MLAQLEQDGLVASFTGRPRAGQERRSYSITEEGEQVLRQWIGVIKDEHDGLGRVLRRYVATETRDAQLAEVVGGWQRVVGPVFSAVSASSTADGVVTTVIRRPKPGMPRRDRDGEVSTTRFEVNPEASVILIDARSSVGPITFGALGLSGFLFSLIFAALTALIVKSLPDIARYLKIRQM